MVVKNLEDNNDQSHITKPKGITISKKTEKRAEKLTSSTAKKIIKNEK